MDISKLRLQDLPSGHDGKGYVALDGRILEAFRITKISSKVEVKKDARQFLGSHMEQNAVRGLKGSGDVSYVHATSAFIEAMKTYRDSGIYPDITFQYFVETKALGRCEVLLSGVVLDTVGFGALDDSSDSVMVNDTAFSFDDFDLISKFEEAAK